MRAKQEADILWLYNVSRPAQKAFYRAKSSSKKGDVKEDVVIESPGQPGPSTIQSEPVKPVAVIKVQQKPVATTKTQPKPVVIPEVKAQFYKHGVNEEEEEYYAEFDNPNVYENEETGRAPAIAEYHGPEDDVDYDNLKNESNVYVYKL
eukprot:sb/3473615/